MNKIEAIASIIIYDKDRIIESTLSKISNLQEVTHTLYPDGSELIYAAGKVVLQFYPVEFKPILQNGMLRYKITQAYKLFEHKE